MEERQREWAGGLCLGLGLVSLILPWTPWLWNDEGGWILALCVAPVVALIALAISVVGLVRGRQKRLLLVLGMCLSLATLVVFAVLVWQWLEFVRSG